METAMEPGLVLKATAPRLPKNLLGRSRLSVTGAELGDKVGIAIRAPAGFGKTSLLGQWRRECLARGNVVAWLTLDQRDDALRFAQGLAVATAIASGRTVFNKIASQWGSQGDSDLGWLTRWLAGIAEMAVDTVLVLDDAENLPPATAANSLLYILRNAPANLRIVVGSRVALNLPVADLIASGHVALVDVEQLRFGLDETLSLLAARFGSRVDPHAAARLHELTGGWPLGMQLAIAALAKEGAANLSEAIDQLSAGSNDVERYFVEHLVSRLPIELADLLVRLAAVDVVHPGLCAAITAAEEASDRLRLLKDTTPIFLESSSGEWMRIHPLARHFLKARFDDLPESERRAVHGRAAEWFAEHQHLDAAAHHALSAGLEQRAWELVERSLFDTLVLGQVGRVLEWSERLPREEIERRPRLRVAAGWGFALSDRPAAATELVGRFLDDPQVAATDRFESAMICAAAAFWADDIDRGFALIAPWFDAVPTDDPRLRALLANQQAGMTLYRGSPELARYHLLRAPRYTSPVDHDYIRAFAEWLAGVSYLWEGQAALAQGVLSEALRRADDAIGRRSAAAAQIASALGVALWDRDRPQEVATTLANRIDVLERIATPEAIIMGYVSAARVAAWQNEEHRSMDLLQSLFALGEARGIARFCVASLSEQIRLHALGRRGETCMWLLNRLVAVSPAPEARTGIVRPLMGLTADIAHARGALAQRDPERALTYLDRALPVAERLRRGRDSVEIRLLRAIAMQDLGNDASASMSEALSLAASLGLERIVSDVHPDLPERTAAQRTGRAAPSAAPVARQSSEAPRVVPSGLLTPKESQVLALLARNLSNKHIAAALSVSDETIKWHLKNLFGKLNAGTREHLVARARMLGILE